MEEVKEFREPHILCLTDVCPKRDKCSWAVPLMSSGTLYTPPPDLVKKGGCVNFRKDYVAR